MKEGWLISVTNDLKDQLDWYFSHYPQYIGKSREEAQYIPQEEMKCVSLLTSYKWEVDNNDKNDDKNDDKNSDYKNGYSYSDDGNGCEDNGCEDKGTVTITVNIRKYNNRQMIRLLDELSILLIKRVSLLDRKNYIIVIEDKSRFPAKYITENPIYFSKISNKDNNVSDLSTLCSSFDDFIDLCEENKIALKMFYVCNCGENDNENDKIKREFFVNSYWIY